MKAKFFPNQIDFRKWLEENHQSAEELIVGFYKVNSGKPSMTWPESVDQALCFGWIDGVRHSIDSESYQIRFTPRRKNSVWSTVNCKKVETLIAQGLMQPSGLEIYLNRKPEKSGIYAFEQAQVQLAETLECLIKKNKAAWKYFQSLTPAYQKSAVHWIMSAKQEKTRISRTNDLIKDWEASLNRWKDNKYSKKEK